jgi:hypothetical protein
MEDQSRRALIFAKDSIIGRAALKVFKRSPENRSIDLTLSWRTHRNEFPPLTEEATGEGEVAFIGDVQKQVQILKRK